MMTSMWRGCGSWFPGLVMAVVLSAPPAMARTLGSPLPLMLALRDRGEHRVEYDGLLPGIADDDVGLSVRVRAPLDADLSRRIEATGAEILRDDRGRPWHLGSIYTVRAPWSSVRALASIPEIERLELARQPGLVRHLDVSVPEIEAPLAWERRDQQGRTIDGTGVVIADFDSGVDVFHPLFFHADGGLFEWLDVNANGRVDPGVDAVDLDGDGQVGAGEVLGLMEGAFGRGERAGWVDGSYDLDTDWLFADQDQDGERDYGPEAGYTDDDPSFGELLFIVDDVDGDSVLDSDEWLIGLGTSKIIATLMWPETIRYRGVDLIETPLIDPEWERYIRGTDVRSDHGTGVCSVLAGGWARSGRRVTGIAPGAELIVVDFRNELGLVFSIPWAISIGATVGTHPYGHKIYSFLDGSSNEELAIDHAVTEANVPQVISVGNSAHDRDDATILVPAESTTAVPFEVYYYSWQSEPIHMVAMTLRWRRPEVRLSFRLGDPEGRHVDLGGAGGFMTIGNAHVDFSREDSPRGTAKFDVTITQMSGIPVGEWTLEVSSVDEGPTEVWATIFNDIFAGGSGTDFIGEDQVTMMATVHGNATADQALGACSYGTRHSYAGEIIGEISGFSSRGPRIDGFRIVDLCAPGDNDIIWAQSSRGNRPLGGYSFGGGTSASAPHVGGAIALLQQAAPWASSRELEDVLYSAALVDEFMGEPVPNHTWGYGKLRIAEALDHLPPEPELQTEEEVDLRPWEGGLTPDAGPPRLPGFDGELVGVEGGGCHCRASSARLEAGGPAAFFRALWR